MGYSYQSREEKLLDAKYEHDDDFDEADTYTEEDAADDAYTEAREREHD